MSDRGKDQEVPDNCADAEHEDYSFERAVNQLDAA